MEDFATLERGIGPIQLGSAKDPPLEEGFLSSGLTTFLRIERVLLAIFYLVMMAFCIYNTWSYLYKARMYKSYPLMFLYIIIFLYSLHGIFYELFMGFHCGDQDCFTHLMVTIMPEYELLYREETHKSLMAEIGVLWKIRQQLFWGLAMAQLLIIGTLAIKINSIETTLNLGAQAEVMRDRLNSADKRSKWLAYVITSIFLLFAIGMITITAPGIHWVHTESYNAFYLVEITVTTIVLILTLVHLYKKIRSFNTQSNNALSSETGYLLNWCIILLVALFVKIVLNGLQNCGVYNVIDLR